MMLVPAADPLELRSMYQREGCKISPLSLKNMFYSPFAVLAEAY